LNLRRHLLTVFGLGHMPIASGTWGSLPAAGIALGLAIVIGPHWTIDGVLVLTGLLFSIACVRFGDSAEEEFGRKDPGQVVADEMAGQCVALLLLPWREDALLYNAALAATGFLAFRFFDILKPPPANGLQRIPGGWGILIDDLVAGVYALIVTQLAARFLWAGMF
jgi:phosphatidylglycerophosphatase A